ncbi:MAG: hypothetical protein Q8Q08_01345 [Candidatus Omnitrophota bacterium]|nr:hypothetical protein [Candidatus Omnitrophota bacterium]MDZ4241604.1 hypothetical protein [Candidatus Omnitrophota bacterium]
MRMLRWVMLACVAGGLFLSAAGNSPAQETLESALAREGLTSQEMADVVTYYYRDFQPDKLVKVLNVILAQDEAANDPIHFQPFAHFIATAARDNPDLLKKLQDLEARQSGVSKTLVAQIIAQTLDFQSPDPSSPFFLDYLWGEFLASGSEAPVRKIISALDHQWPDKDAKLSDEDVARALTHSAARWSLASNAQQHPLVKEIIQKVLSEPGSEALKGELEAVLKDSAEIQE